MGNSQKAGLQARRSFLKKKPQTTTSNLSQVLEQGVMAGNGTSLALIHAFRQFLPKLFVLARFVLVPFNAAANIARGFIALYDAHKEGYKPGSTLRAVIALVTGFGVAISLLGGLLASAAFAFAGPVLAVISFSIRALYNACAAIYYSVQAFNATDPVEKQKYRSKAIANAINSVAAALNGLAIALVVLALKASMGILGIMSGVITAVFAFYKLLTIKPVAALPPPKTEDPFSTERLNRNLKFNLGKSKDDTFALKKEDSTEKTKTSSLRFFSKPPVVAVQPNFNPSPTPAKRRYSI